jgi:hypothetical protein
MMVITPSTLPRCTLVSDAWMPPANPGGGEPGSAGAGQAGQQGEEGGRVLVLFLALSGYRCRPPFGDREEMYGYRATGGTRGAR